MSAADYTRYYNIPLTLESYFEDLARRFPQVKDVYSLWTLLKKRMEEELANTRGVFVNFSLHDSSHSRSVLQGIERFLGEERIARLSATDTFMLLACAYAHDYGMAQSFTKIYDILGSSDFEEFLNRMKKEQASLEKEDYWAVCNLLDYLDREKEKIPLNDMYFSIMLAIQLYLRPIHWKEVRNLENDFHGLLQGQMKKRFIHGGEGVVEICMCHGQSVEELLRLSYRADGMMGDDYHPRFVAAMLRLGDLLDLDNGRFPMWFVSGIAENRNLIPRLSVMHFRKHEAISHLLITPKHIEITAECRSREEAGLDQEDAERESYEVAGLVSDWTDGLRRECEALVMHWNGIAPPDFGNPPGDLKIQIFVDERPYSSEGRRLQMRMSQDRVMKLLEGTSIYSDKYVGIREMIQNAVDASLLQLWKEIIQNRYIKYGLSKDAVQDGLDMMDMLQDNRAAIFGNYDIQVEVIRDRKRKQVFVVVKDKGVGITPEDMEYISNIGSSKDENEKNRKLMKSMPRWLKPSGIFGIGLQSLFQLTDCIEFYTRQHNMPEQLISLYSYGKNRGKIEVREVSPKEEGLFYDNAIPGTNVKISVEERKFLKEGNDAGETGLQFSYYDSEFDAGESFDMLFTEVVKACKQKIEESEYDYFNVSLQEIEIDEEGNPSKRDDKCQRNSYFAPNKKQNYFGTILKDFERSTEGEPYSFIENRALYWDRETCRSYRLKVRPCGIREQDGKTIIIFPEKIPDLYRVSYKFNHISNAEAVYSSKQGAGRLHAGFFQVDVHIFDDRPTDYMNIDRMRLRKDAIDEKEILDVKKLILRRWCEYLCAVKEKKERKEAAKKKENQEREKQEKELLKNFGKDQPMLVSIILLFYQNVPEELFRRFEGLYREKIEALPYFLEDGINKVHTLWGKDQLFQISQEIEISGLEEEGPEPPDSVIKMRLGVLRRLPHRMINIEKIFYRDHRMYYLFRLKDSAGCAEPVDMSDIGSLYDYIQTFELHSEGAKRIKWYSVQKKLFKPDSRYGELLIPCYPQTFDKGKNLLSDLDYCIEWYILSPFNEEGCGVIKDWIKEIKEWSKGAKKCQEEKREYQKKKPELQSALTDKVMAGEQLEKCVSYILKKRFPELKDQKEKREEIREQYRAFVMRFAQLFESHYQLIMNIDEKEK